MVALSPVSLPRNSFGPAGFYEPDTQSDVFAPLLDRARRAGRLYERDVERFLESLPALASAHQRAMLLQRLLDADVEVLEGSAAGTLLRLWEALFYWKKVIAYSTLLTALVGHEWWIAHLRVPLAGPPGS